MALLVLLAVLANHERRLRDLENLPPKSDGIYEPRVVYDKFGTVPQERPTVKVKPQFDNGAWYWQHDGWEFP